MNYPSQYNPPTHTLLHISDSQLVGNDGKWNGFSLDADAKLAETVQTIVNSKRKADAIIFTGDIADNGEDNAYKKLLDITAPLHEISDNILWVMGNHDKREPFKTLLLNEPSNNKPVDYTVNINGLKIVVLDTTVPGEHYGAISNSQLEWLEEELQTDSPYGTILALHHPPVPVVMPLAITVELREQKKLAEVVRKAKNLRAIIGGHMHYSVFSTFAGVPVSVASSTCYTQDLGTIVGATRGRDTAQSYNLIEIYEENILHAVVPVGSSNVIGKEVSPIEVEKILFS
jgi:Icc protein